MILKYDVLVIGGGHAGCEAAMAAANMGAKTCLVTMDMNKIAQMSCNPAVGGIAKGQIVREIDALGGGMGIVTDATAIQFRMLNRSKGPAMWSPRAQCDREKFIWEWRKIIDNTDNLDIWQDQAEELLVENGEAVGVRTVWGVELLAGCTVITAGTFLNGLMHIGRKKVEGGRIAEPAVKNFTESITRHGIKADRMKTGTPVRIDKRSVDFSLMEVQDGEQDFHQFSYMGDKRVLKQLPCWTCNTNKEVHQTLLGGMADSPLYNGQIQSIGPRYCPSVETKLMTFPDKEQHPLFLEPEGVDTNEMYLNGFSSSLPMEVQIEALRKVPAFRDLKVYRPGYAIEYDFFDPTQLYHSLESKIIPRLFFAGQVNGTTGYEEAGGQGLVAGANAAIRCHGREPFVMHRDESYIGVLIDDLVTKGVDEPYRMFTSRAEYRLLLREDNADQRLTETGRKLGLVGDARWQAYQQKMEAIATESARLKDMWATPANALGKQVTEQTGEVLSKEATAYDLLKRPQIHFADIKAITDSQVDAQVGEQIEISVKYAGYIDRQQEDIEQMKRLENTALPMDFDYNIVSGLSNEIVQKLNHVRPATLAQASRVSGVTPAAIQLLAMTVKKNKKAKAALNS